MKYIMDKDDLIIEDAEDFELKHIFECGQCFRWDEEPDGAYIGIADNYVLKIAKENTNIRLYNTSSEIFEHVWRKYFDFETDYGYIKRVLSRDPVLNTAIKAGNGIRILNQDLWETLISFIISASNNIPRIKGIISRLCENFGNKIEYMGETYYSFPSPENIAKLELQELSVIRAGFRDKYILSAARQVASGEVLLNNIYSMDTVSAKKELTSFAGVGPKVADCVLLFALHKTDAFPVDVWVKRIMEYCYFHEDTKKDDISRFAMNKFGEYAGYAQQYLFYWARENHIGV